MRRSLLSFRAPVRVVIAATAVLVFVPVMALAPGAHAVEPIPQWALVPDVAGPFRTVAAAVIAANKAPTFDELADRCDAEATRTSGSRTCRAAAYMYLAGKGLSPKQASGVIGNLWVESNGVSPKSRQFGGGPGRGIAQWTYNQRWLGVLALARARNVSPDTLRVQLDFLWHELTTRYRSALAAMDAAPSVLEATVAFQNIFEVPVGTAIGAPPFTVNVHPAAHTVDRVARAVAVHDVWSRSVAEWPRLITPSTP
jgi:hypothetical protein